MDSAILPSHSDLATVLDRVGEAFFALGPDWRFVAANAAAERHFGLGRSALLGRSFLDLVPAIRGSELLRHYEAAMRGAERRFEGFSSVDPHRRVSVEAFPWGGGLGVVLRDVTGERNLKADFDREVERSRGNAALLRAVLSSTDGVVFAKDLSGRYLLMSDAGCRLFGRPGEAFVGLTDDDIMSAARAAEARANDRAVIDLGQPLRFDERMEIDGVTRTFESIKAPLRDGDGPVIGVVGVLVDVTELRLDKERLEVVLAGADLGSWHWNVRTGKATYNERWASMLGYRLDEVDGSYDAWKRLIHPEDRERVLGVMADHLKGRTSLYDCEHRLRHKDGGWIWVLSRGRAVERDPDGQPLLVTGTHLDVTERRRAQEALREGQKRWQALVEAMPQLVWSCDAEGRCDYLSRQWVEYTGAFEGEHYGDGWLQAIHPEDRERASQAWTAAVAGEAPYEIEYRLRGFGGTYRWFQVRGAAIRDEDGTIRRWFGTSTDVDVRKRAEEELRASEAQYRALFDAAGVGKAEVDPATGRFLRVNRTLCRIAGHEASDLLALRLEDLVHPEDRAEVAEAFRRLVAGEADVQESEGRCLRPDGEVVWIALTATLGRDAASRPLRAIAVIQDVTSRRAAEERQRLLMREVDHRAKNALAVVQSLVRLTPADTPERFVAAVEGRVAALARAHTLLAHEGWAGADVASLVGQELAPYEDEHAGSARGRVVAGGPALRVSPHAAQPLGMALHELATNAAKYGALSAPEGRVDVTWCLDPEGWLDLIWTETGGPPVSQPSRTGFGSMLIQASLKRQLSGAVDLDWAPTGLVARLRVPSTHVLRGAGDRKAPQAPAGPSGHLNGTRILVAEDNAMLSLELEQILGWIGCILVGPAATVEDALALARSADVDAAVLDVDLQGRPAFPVAEELAARGVPVVFATGFDRPAPNGRWAEAPCLRKPYGRDELAAALRAALAR